MNHLDGTAPVLHHLCLQSDSPAQLIDFYSQVMGYSFSVGQSTSIGYGAERCLVIEPGVSKTLSYSAFSVADDLLLNALKDRLKHNGVSLESSPTPVFDKHAFAVRDPDNNCIVFGVKPASPVSATATVPGSLRPAGNDDARPLTSLPGRLQHVVVATQDLPAMIDFYHQRLGFGIADNVMADDGKVTACFMHSDQEHHSFAAFRAPSARLDHHCYEVGDWDLIRDWSDHFARFNCNAMWGPGRHGVGNNLFAMFEDPDGNWIEVSAELEQITQTRVVGEWQHGERALNLWGRAIMRS